MTTRHQFLASLHELIQPQVYVETGVQTGASLVLSKAPLSIGIDPAPMITPGILNAGALVFTATSDDYFGALPVELEDQHIDLAFVDGMHLAEYALRDFYHIEQYSHPCTVAVFDDVLPRNQEEAARVMGAGDWTGDVWRVWTYLRLSRRGLRLTLVDTEPTGTLVVTGLDPEHVAPPEIQMTWSALRVPEYVIDRRHAWPADLVLEQLTRWRKQCGSR